MSIFGGQRQEKRQGYNKFNAYDVAFVNGINTNQEIIKSENNIVIPFLATWSRRKCTINNLKHNTTYKIFCTKNGDEGIESGLWDGSNYTSTGFSTNSSAKLYIDVSTDENGTLTFFFYCNYSATNHGNKTVEFDEIMVTEGTEDKRFELFGAMPSLEYPSKIEAVGDNIQLLQNSNQKVNSFGLTAETQQDEAVKIFGKSTSSSQVYLTNIKKIDVSNITDEDYTFSFRNAQVLNRIGIRLRKNNNGTLTEVDNFKLDTINKIRTLNLKSLIDSNTTEIQLDIILYSADNYDITLCMKCEKGSKATSYSSFGQGSVEITTSNKNALKNTAKSVSSNGINFAVNDDGTILANGTATANATLRIFSGKNVFNGLTLSGCPKTGTQSVFTSATFWDDDWNYKDYRNDYGDGILLDSEYTQIIVELRIANGTKVNNLVFKPMISYNSEYVEHKGETHIMPIQQAMFDGDGFEKIDGVWYEKHNWGIRVFDGTENFGMDSTNKSFYVREDRAKRLTNYKDEILCNCYSSIETFEKGVSGVSGYHRSETYPGQNWIYFTDENYENVASFKAMLAQKYAEGNPLYVIYTLAETEYIKCTAEQSAILDKIDTYRNGTIITTDNDLCKISLRYKQDLESRISELEKQIVGGN